MKNIIIFGGAGFIGTNLTKRLLEKGNKILCFDNLSTSSIENVRTFNNKNNYRFIEADIVDVFDDDLIIRYINDFFKNENNSKYTINEIYNLACPASPPKYQINPLHTLDTCVAVKDICKLAQRYNSKVLHASTSEVYGDPLVHPQTEDYRGNVNTIGPRSCYDEGKRVAETYCYEYAKKGVDVKLIRIFNTYGPFMNAEDGRVVSNFINQALNGEDITIYGDGSQTRSFQYIDDLLDAIEKVMETDKSFMGPINLGNPHEFTVKELAEKVVSMIGTKSKIIYKDLPIDDPKIRRPNIDLAKKVLGWTPKIQLSDGLEKTIKYFDSYKNGENFLT